MEPKTLREKMENRAGQKALIHWMIADGKGPVYSDGLPGGQPGQAFGPGTYVVACDPKMVPSPTFLATGATNAVTCEECMKNPRFAAEYQARPSAKKYEDIPAEHRAAIEEWEKTNVKPAWENAKKDTALPA